MDALVVAAGCAAPAERAVQDLLQEPGDQRLQVPLQLLRADELRKWPHSMQRNAL
jgi:hypothetical protein